MAVSDARFAGQVVAPHEEPLLFDDLGCLGREWRATPRPRAVAYVADHRTREWVLAERAVWTRVPGLETPMGSHLIAHKDAASRDQDPDARGGTDVPASEVLGPARGAGGPR
jgi:copper chaperone NosL